ncbi:MAG: EndoU domain-containing protein [bacterium]
MSKLASTLSALLLLSLFCPAAIAQKKIWSNTQPPVNLTHIFQGEINRKGKPTGFHSKFNGKIAEGAKILRIKGKPNDSGVYTADIAVLDPATGEWKKKFSSMFPDKINARTVVEAILHAYKHRKKGKSTPWRGPSGLGFPIEGYLLRNGKINTAYPIYIRGRNQ